MNELDHLHRCRNCRGSGYYSTPTFVGKAYTLKQPVRYMYMYASWCFQSLYAQASKGERVHSALHINDWVWSAYAVAGHCCLARILPYLHMVSIMLWHCHLYIPVQVLGYMHFAALSDISPIVTLHACRSLKRASMPSSM